MRGLLFFLFFECLVVAEATSIRAKETSDSSPAREAKSDERSAPGALASRALQTQMKEQAKRIDTLINTVQALTAQLQHTLPISSASSSTTEKAEKMSEPQAPVAVSAELRENQLTLAKLREAEQEAQAAQTPEQIQKQLELQRKEIEVLNKMVKLLAEQLQKQGPIVSKLQTDVATLEARSKQGAQRDQEIANVLDNLTENVDASQRYGPQLPAPLKEWFLPSGTNETPFSIYNQLGMRYNYFPSSRVAPPFQSGAGQFQFIEYDPLFLLQLNKQFLFESQLEIHQNGHTGLEFAQIDWMANDWLTVVGGRFMVPIGSFNDRLHYMWINKLPDYPIFAWAVVPFDFNLNGVQTRGSRYLFGSPVKMEYAFYVANGWGIPGQGGVTDFVNINSQTDSSKSINNAIAFGGRVGFWIPILGFNGGVSYFGNRPYTAADGVNIDIWDIDLNYHRGNWDLRFEGAQTFQNTTGYIGNNILLQGLYGQVAYRPYNASNRYLQRTEGVFRYSMFRGSGFTPGQLDLTQFTFPNQASVPRNQYTFGLNYYPYPSMAIRFAYEINQELDMNLHDNALLAQFAWGF